jgi:hypothetical protein
MLYQVTGSYVASFAIAARGGRRPASLSVADLRQEHPSVPAHLP